MKKLLYTAATYLLLSFSMQAHAQITNNLQAYYPFGGNAQDQSGNGNNGQVTGNVSLTQDRFGITGCAYAFDGTAGSYISIPSSPSFAYPGGAFSVSLWYKGATTAQGDAECLFGANNGSTIAGNYAYWLGLYDLNKATFYSSWEPDNLVNTAIWNHLVGIYDNGDYILYKNGVLIDSTHSNLLNTGNNMMIIGRGFAGAIDDVRFYNRKINANEIGQLYALQSSCSPTTIPEQQVFRINLYPNPIRQDLTIECSTPLTEATVTIYNILGQLVKQQAIKGSLLTTIDFSDKAPGSYIIKVQEGNKVLSAKIIQKL